MGLVSLQGEPWISGGAARLPCSEETSEAGHHCGALAPQSPQGPSSSSLDTGGSRKPLSAAPSLPLCGSHTCFFTRLRILGGPGHFT